MISTRRSRVVAAVLAWTAVAGASVSAAELHPVFLIHGYDEAANANEGARSWSQVQPLLAAGGWNAVEAVELYRNGRTANTLIDALADVARTSFDQFAAAHPGELIDVVGYSMGAVVFRAMLARGLDPARIGRAVTLGGPHYGTSPTLAGAATQQAQQMIYGGAYLRDLAIAWNDPARRLPDDRFLSVAGLSEGWGDGLVPYWSAALGTTPVRYVAKHHYVGDAALVACAGPDGVVGNSDDAQDSVFRLLSAFLRDGTVLAQSQLATPAVSGATSGAIFVRVVNSAGAPVAFAGNVVKAIAGLSASTYTRVRGSGSWANAPGTEMLIGTPPDSSSVAGIAAGTYAVTINAATNPAHAEFVVDSVGIAAGRTSFLTVTLPSATIAIVEQPAGLTAMADAAIQFAVTATGPGPLAYQWQFNSADIAGATAATYAIDPVRSVHAGAYRVVITSGAESVTSDAATLVFEKATPLVGWNVPAPIGYGTALSSVQLNATASVAGTFAYVPVAGVVLGGGPNQSLSVTFTPADNANYTTATGSVSLTVNKAAASVAIDAPLHLFDGTPQPVVVTTTPAGLPVAVTYDGSSTAPSAVGTYAVLADIVSDNYSGAAAAALVIVAIVVQASVSSVTAGNEVRLVASVGGVATSFQWQVRVAGAGAWTDLPGATGAEFVLPSAQRFNAAEYRVVTMMGGAAVTSAPVAIAVSAPPVSDARLLNLSTRALVQTGDNVLIPGFVIAGTAVKKLLIRAVGPTLDNPPINFGGGTLPDPTMTLKRHNFTTNTDEDVTANDDWQTNPNAADIATTAASLGAFALTDANDAALLIDLTPGQYTVVASDTAGATGIAIVELYDADANGGASRLINISNRGFVGVGANIMIPGFVVSSEGPKTFLIRAVGPRLAGFGVSGTMVDPKLTVFRSNSPALGDTEILNQDNWGESSDAANTAAIATQVSAFPLTAGSTDAAFVVTLAPGLYTVHGKSADGVGTGVVLVEVYVVE